MNWSENKFYLDIVQWLVTLALATTVWLRKPGTDAGLAVNRLRADVDLLLNAYTQRLTEIEAHMKHMATSEQLAQLSGTVMRIDERTQATDNALDHLRIQLNRIEDYLRNRK